MRRADIVSAATISAEPLIRGDWLAPGTHVDCVGAYKPSMRETDDAVVRRARIFVDTRTGAFAEAGDIVQPLAGRRDRQGGRARRSLRPHPRHGRRARRRRRKSPSSSRSAPPSRTWPRPSPSMEASDARIRYCGARPHTVELAPWVDPRVDPGQPRRLQFRTSEKRVVSIASRELSGLNPRRPRAMPPKSKSAA